MWPFTGKHTLMTFRFWAGFRLQPFVNCSKKICIHSNDLVTRSLETPTRLNYFVTRSIETLIRSNDLVTRLLETPTRSNDLVTHLLKTPTRSNNLVTPRSLKTSTRSNDLATRSLETATCWIKCTCNNYSEIRCIFSFAFLHQLSGITFFVS